MSTEQREKPYAGCPNCQAPLVSTFEKPKYEWWCGVCERFLEWLSARPVEATPEVAARYAELKEAYDQARAARKAQAAAGETT